MTKRKDEAKRERRENSRNRNREPSGDRPAATYKVRSNKWYDRGLSASFFLVRLVKLRYDSPFE